MTSITAISLHQPYASLLVHEAMPKIHETRSWPVPARLVGRTVLIHAAKRVHLDEDVALICRQLWGLDWRGAIPRGAFVGTVIFGPPFRITGERQAAGLQDVTAGDWTPGRWAWPTTARHQFATPVAAPGRQGWWNAPISDLPEGARPWSE